MYSTNVTFTIIKESKNMILEQETLQKFGYTIESLTNKSKKKIYVRCDYCGKRVQKTMQSVSIGRETVKKDSCKKCRFKKREDVSVAKYGVRNSAQREDVRKKISEASSERLKSDEFKELVRNINLKKYGVESVMRNPNVVKKQRQTLLDRYGEDNPSKIREFKQKATKAMIETRIKTGSYQSYKGKTRPQIAKEQGFSRSHFGKLVNKYGFEEAVQMTPSQSSLETFVEKWLGKSNIEYEKQFRVNSKIADFRIGNVILEVDGLYWHSDANKQNKKYHAEKRQIYIDSGYTPLFFREDEVYNRFEIVKSIIRNKLKLNNTKIFARKCFHTTTEKSFFDNNHLMGRGYGDIFALSYNGDVVAAIQMRRLKNKEYEISRFCTSLNVNVVGGFSKLLKRAISELSPISIKTFIDLRYGTGHYLNNLGFSSAKPHLSFRWTDGIVSIHRLRFRGNSGYEKGLFRIWDCGQQPYVMNIGV